nr:hypothetical protein [Tanacetum cinerariifolium]
PSDTPVCYLCTYEQCGNILNYGTCLNCNSGTGNSFAYDTISESYDEVPNPPSQCHFNIYLCQIYESNSHYGYECVNPFIDHHCCYECESSLNDFFCPHCTCEFCGNGAHVGYNCPAQVPSLQTLPGFPQQYPCCEDCGVTHESYQCQPKNHDYYNEQNSCYDSNSFGFDHGQPPRYTVNHPIVNAHNDFLDSQNELAISQNKIMEQMTQLTSIDYQSCSDEDFLEEIFSNPLFEEEINSMMINQHHFNAESDLIESLLNRDSSIISSSLKIDSLLDEFASELTLLKSISSRINETDCHPENEIRFTERLFNSFMEEIDLTFTPDDPMPLSIKEDDDDSRRDILIHEELLDNYSLSIPIIESFYFDNPSFSRPPAKPPDGNTRILNIKIMGDNSEQKVPIPGLMITLVSNQEKSHDILSHRSLENFQLSAKCPTMIHGKNIPILDVPLFHFYPP